MCHMYCTNACNLDIKCTHIVSIPVLKRVVGTLAHEYTRYRKTRHVLLNVSYNSKTPRVSISCVINESQLVCRIYTKRFVAPSSAT